MNLAHISTSRNGINYEVTASGVALLRGKIRYGKAAIKPSANWWATRSLAP